jgi:hypothetical protein
LDCPENPKHLSFVGPEAFAVGAEVVTFSEVPIFTSIPFTIGNVSFTDLARAVYNYSGGPPSPSGAPYLLTRTLLDDVIEMRFSTPIRALGAYFDASSNIPNIGGHVTLELFNGSTSLGTFDAIPYVGTFEGFIGVATDSGFIDRAILRDVDPTQPISFGIDDVAFIAVPEPATVTNTLIAILILATLNLGRRVALLACPVPVRRDGCHGDDAGATCRTIPRVTTRSLRPARRPRERPG